MSNCKIEKLMVKLVAVWTFINVAPLKFQLTFRTTLFSVIHTVATGQSLKSAVIFAHKLDLLGISWS